MKIRLAVALIAISQALVANADENCSLYDRNIEKNASDEHVAPISDGSLPCLRTKLIFTGSELAMANSVLNQILPTLNGTKDSGEVHLSPSQVFRAVIEKHKEIEALKEVIKGGLQVNKLIPKRSLSFSDKMTERKTNKDIKKREKELPEKLRNSQKELATLLILAKKDPHLYSCALRKTGIETNKKDVNETIAYANILADLITERSDGVTIDLGNGPQTMSDWYRQFLTTRTIKGREIKDKFEETLKTASAENVEALRDNYRSELKDLGSEPENKTKAFHYLVNSIDDQLRNKYPNEKDLPDLSQVKIKELSKIKKNIDELRSKLAEAKPGEEEKLAHLQKQIEDENEKLKVTPYEKYAVYLLYSATQNAFFDYWGTHADPQQQQKIEPQYALQFKEQPFVVGTSLISTKNGEQHHLRFSPNETNPKDGTFWVTAMPTENSSEKSRKKK